MGVLGSEKGSEIPSLRRRPEYPPAEGAALRAIAQNRSAFRDEGASSAAASPVDMIRHGPSMASAATKR
jgi:hypothetical protein